MGAPQEVVALAEGVRPAGAEDLLPAVVRREMAKRLEKAETEQKSPSPM